MRTFQIYDAHNTSLLSDYPVYEAQSPSKAIRAYLKDKGESNIDIKVSANTNVRFGALPCVIENGKAWRLPKRRTWFKAMST